MLEPELGFGASTTVPVSNPRASGGAVMMRAGDWVEMSIQGDADLPFVVLDDAR